jgi:hypothetical protein
MKSRDKMIFVINRLLGCFFEMLYHQLAAAYDLVAWLVSLGDGTGGLKKLFH